MYDFMMQGLYHFESYPEQEEISFALLGTCRQVYKESKDVFWNHNTFYTQLVETRRPGEMNISNRVPYFILGYPQISGFKHKIAKMELVVELRQLNLGEMQKALASFRDWALNGCLNDLKSHTEDALELMDGLAEPTREDGLILVDLLKSLYKTRRKLAGLGVIMRLKLKINGLETDSMTLEERLKRLRVNGRGKVLKLMHDSLGGELWINEVLYYQDGLEVKTFFAEWEKKIAAAKVNAGNQEAV